MGMNNFDTCLDKGYTERVKWRRILLILNFSSNDGYKFEIQATTEKFCFTSLGLRDYTLYIVFLLQELRSRLDNATQEKNDLLNKVSSLEESVSSAGSEREMWEVKMNELTDEKAEIENKLASMTENLEATKQVCYLRNLSNHLLILRTLQYFKLLY